MDDVLSKLKNVREFLLIFVGILLLSFHYFFVYFINSTYLSGVLNEGNLGYVYTAGAVLNITLFLIAPKILKRFGNYKLTLWLSLIELVALLGLAAFKTPTSIIFFFLLHQMAVPVLLYCMDIFLEKYSPLKETGSIRGISLTMLNLPPIITPFIAGLILTKPDYWKIYLIAATFLIPFLAILISYFKTFKDEPYPVVTIKDAALKFYRDKNIFDVFIDHFLLHLFYGWMVIYMPIYLKDHIGFSWSEIGLMFSIMLLPFILFQIPIGRLEDKYHDEKQVLILGFSIMAAATMMIPFIEGAHFVLWTLVLFTTRIGASLVEVSSDSYFFKHIHPNNTGFISFYRMTRSLPLLISPAIVGLTLIFLDIKYIFLVLGIIILLGVRYALKLRT
jgi:MFS family permease